MVAPLILPLAYSRSQLIALTLVHLVPLVASCGYGVPLAFRGIIILAVSVSAFFQYQYAKSSMACALELDVEGNVFLIKHSKRKQVILHADYADLGWWIVLHWEDEFTSRHERVVLTWDGLGSVQWRALKIWLYWHAAKLQLNKNSISSD